MTDSPSARENAERIVAMRERLTVADVLAYGRRERAQGMRDAAVMCADLGSERERNCIPETADQASSEAAMLRLCARRVEHRARETEGTVAQPVSDSHTVPGSDQ